MRYAVKSAPPPGGGPNEFVMSDSTVDRVGDVVEAKGWQLANFKNHPIALFNHDRDQVIGKWADVRVVNGELRGRLELADEGTSPLVDTIRRLHAQKILRAVSVGFRPLQQEPLTKDADKNWGPFRFTKSELLECSLVSVPANPNALALAKGLPHDAVAEIFRKPANENLDRSAAPHGKPAAQHLEAKGFRSMNMHQGTLSQRIKSANDDYTALRERLAEIADNDNASAEDMQRAAELPAEIETARNLVDQLTTQERALAATTTREAPARALAQIEPPVERHGEIMPPPRRPTIALSAINKKMEPGDYIFRSLAAWSSAVGSRESLDNILRDKFGNDERLHSVLRAVANPAMTTVAGWAAELNVTENQGFLDRLLPDSIYPRLANRGQRITFTNTNSIKVPTRTTTSQLAGAWVGEGGAKPVKKGSFSSITLNPYKLAVISTFTEEMAMYSVPQIEGIIRKAMQDDTSISLDSYLIDAITAVNRPPGLLNGVTPITASAATTTADKIVADMTALSAAILTAGGGQDIVYLMNPLQAQKLGLATAANGVFMFPDATAAAAKFMGSIIASSTVPAGRVIAIDANELITANGDTPRFAVSTEATLHEEDTTPLALSATGSPNVVAAPMRSLFQTDAVAIRMVIYVTWQMRRAGMVQTIAAVGW